MKVPYGSFKVRHLVMCCILVLVACSAAWLMAVNSEPYELGASYLKNNRDVMKVAGAVRSVSLDFFAGYYIDGQSAEYQADVIGEAANAVVKMKLVNEYGVWKVSEAKLIP